MGFVRLFAFLREYPIRYSRIERRCLDAVLERANLLLVAATDRAFEIESRQRHTLPVRLGCVGCSFQLGLTSILFPRLPHLAQTTRDLKYGISVSAG